MYKNPLNLVEIEIDEEVFSLEDLDAEIEIIQKEGNQYLIRYQNHHYPLEVVHRDSGVMKVRMGGHTYTVSLRTEIDRLVRDLGFQQTSANQDKEVLAPMPGLVLDISVNIGDTVTEGQALLTLEAMKMENIIKSPGDGTILSIHMQKGDKVEKGSILIGLE